MKTKLDPATLRSVANLLTKEARWWAKSCAGLPPESYGYGFRHGMAEQARRVVQYCREKAKPPANKRKTKTK